jgi:hypothetical protein
MYALLVSGLTPTAPGVLLRVIVLPPEVVLSVVGGGVPP